MEAVLFTMGKSVDLAHLAAAIESTPKAAENAVTELAREYDEQSRGMQIIRLNDSYQMCTREEFYNNLITVVKIPKKQNLTDAMLETLSIVAYRQPVTRLEIEKIRGVKSDHAMSKLLEYDLIYEVGRMEAPGRPMLFATTEEFLRRFGVSGKDELPKVPEDKTKLFAQQAAEEIRLDDPEMMARVQEEAVNPEFDITSDSQENRHDEMRDERSENDEMRSESGDGEPEDGDHPEVFATEGTEDENQN